MTAREILKIGKYPALVKLNDTFDEVVEESFDFGTILQILDIKMDVDDAVMISVKAPKEFMQYNESIAISDWYDKNSNPRLTIYECFPEKFKDGEFYDTIWVMADDGVFDIMDDDYILKAVSDISKSIAHVTRPLLESMCKKYPNDQELGREIRKLVNN